MISKNDAKPKLIRWVLLLKEFDMEIRDKKCVYNQIGDHLFKISKNTKERNEVLIKKSFPNETLLSLAGMQWDAAASWYAYLLNLLASGVTPPKLSFQQKKSFLHNGKAYYWDESYLYKKCSIQLLRRCVVKGHIPNIFKHCHAYRYGGHFGGVRITT